MKKRMIITHFVINYICIEDVIKNKILIKNGRIIVGVTDNVRWKNAIEIGDSGVDELTWMSAIITERGSQEQNYMPAQCVDFFSGNHTGPIHALMHEYITELFDIAHRVRNEQLTELQARERYFGYKITKKNSDYDTAAYF